MSNPDDIINQDEQSMACDEGNTALDNKSYKEAIELFKEAMTYGFCKDAYLGLGQAYKKTSDLVGASRILIEAIQNDKLFHEAFMLLGDVYYEGGQGTATIESYAQAVAIDPSNDNYKQKLIKVMSSLNFKKINPNLKGVLIECLESTDIEFVHFGEAWLSIFSSDPLLAQIYKLSKHKNYDGFKKSMDGLPGYDGLIEPFFLTGLGKFIVIDFAFERWCTYLRRYLLEAVTSGTSIFSDPDDMELMTCALSKYCFLTDYIFNICESEKILVDDLQKKIEATDNPNLFELGMAGCYNKLCLLKNTKSIASNLKGGNHVSQIPKSQIEDYFDQVEIKKNIPSLTKIENTVSALVREQYEEFPYPRWESVAQGIYNIEIEGHLKGAKANILNAGCGTGKEAIQIADAFPDATITAIDLSLTSLAYAQSKANQLGIKNIKFMHADIMELGKIEDRFDFIASAGVLHHMDDPKAGWAVLKNLLKPNGIMRIALYSSKARWAINNARKAIKENNISSDADSIKNFRDNINNYIKYKSIKNIAHFYDYYSLPECRDLLFHVQEHQFDIPTIKETLDELNLEFLHMHMPDLKKYKKYNLYDQEVKDLDRLARWENKNHGLFSGMYIFWCKKSDD